MKYLEFAKEVWYEGAVDTEDNRNRIHGLAKQIRKHFVPRERVEIEDLVTEKIYSFFVSWHEETVKVKDILPTYDNLDKKARSYYLNMADEIIDKLRSAGYLNE